MCSVESKPLSAAVMHRLAKELRDLARKPEEGIRVIVNDEDMADIQAEFTGPAGTPYDGGVFRMRLQLGQDFPTAPPKGFFITKIFHPNVSKAGEICVNVLKKDWTADTQLRHLLLIIRCLLIEPFPESALNEEAGRLLMEDYEAYATHARLMTSIHAQPPKRCTPLTASGGNAIQPSGSATGSREGSSETSCPAVKKTKPIVDKAKAKAAAAKKRGKLRL